MVPVAFGVILRQLPKDSSCRVSAPEHSGAEVQERPSQCRVLSCQERQEPSVHCHGGFGEAGTQQGEVSEVASPPPLDEPHLMAFLRFSL